MSFKFCGSGAIIYKAGINVNAKAIVSGAIMEQFSNEAEAQICTDTRYDFSAAYATFNPVFRPTLGTMAANLGAIKLINYDMDSIGKATAVDRINVLNNEYVRNMEAMKKIKKPEVSY
jgi:hypothetical protein